MLSQNEVSGLWLMACNGRKDEKLGKNDFKLVEIRAPRLQQISVLSGACSDLGLTVCGALLCRHAETRSSTRS